MYLSDYLFLFCSSQGNRFQEGFYGRSESIVLPEVPDLHQH